MFSTQLRQSFGLTSNLARYFVKYWLGHKKTCTDYMSEQTVRIDFSKIKNPHKLKVCFCNTSNAALQGSAFASLTSVENSDICQKLFFYFDKFLSNVWKLVRSHHRQRNDIHYDALQFPEITNLTSVQLILTNVRMKYLSRHIFSLKQQLVRQNRLRRFDSDKCQWGRCMAQYCLSLLFRAQSEDVNYGRCRRFRDTLRI